MPEHFQRLSLFASEHSFWSDMTCTAYQEKCLSRLHFDAKVFSVMTEDIRQHAGGQTVVGVCSHATVTPEAAHDAFVFEIRLQSDFRLLKLDFKVTLDFEVGL